MTWWGMLQLLQTAGVITNTHPSYVSAQNNNGTILNVYTTGTYGGLTATATNPIIEVSSHTLVTNDRVMIHMLTGTVGTWPGNGNRFSRYVVTVGTNNYLQLTGLNLTGLSGFTSAGSIWCEAPGNINASHDQQLITSRRYKYAAVDNTDFVYFGSAGSSNVTLNRSGVNVDSCSDTCAFFLSSQDGLSLSTSANILIGICGETLNSGETFASASKLTVTKVGSYPICQTNVSAVVRIPITSVVFGRYVIDDLDRCGNVVSTRRVASIDDKLVIPLSTSDSINFRRLRKL
jgi:hypothetical protein